MAFAALAEGASTFAEAAVQAGTGVFDDWDGADQQTGEQRETKREEKHQRVDADFVDAGQPGGSRGYQHAQRGVGESQADQASGHAKHDAFKEQFAGDATPACAESGADGELLSAALHANQQQVSHVGAGDEQNQRDRAHQYPQHFAYVSDDILLQRPQVGGDARFLKEADAEAFWRGKAAPDNRKEASHVGAGLLDGDAGLHSCEGPLTEVAQLYLTAVPLEGRDDRGILPIEEVKALREDADDLARLAAQQPIRETIGRTTVG